SCRSRLHEPCSADERAGRWQPNQSRRRIRNRRDRRPSRRDRNRAFLRALGAGCGRRGEEGYVPTLLGLSVMLPALFGAVLVHHPHVLAHPASLLGLGMGVFTLVGGLVLLLRQ